MRSLFQGEHELEEPACLSMLGLLQGSSVIWNGSKRDHSVLKVRGLLGASGLLPFLETLERGRWWLALG